MIRNVRPTRLHEILSQNQTKPNQKDSTDLATLSPIRNIYPLKPLEALIASSGPLHLLGAIFGICLLIIQM